MTKLLIVGVFLWVVTCSEPMSSNLGPPVNPGKELNVAFVVVDGVYNSELVAPMDVFHHTRFHTEKGMNVFTVALKDTLITTFEGLKLKPDYALTQDSLPLIDILVVPSAAHSMDTDLQNKELISFIAREGHQAQYVMSLCDGAFVLAKAGLLNHYESTTFPADIDQFKRTFPHLTVHRGVSFVHDRKFLTSAGGAKSYEVALYLTELLYGKSVAARIGEGLVISWDLDEINYLRSAH